jgi:hypothetical protein
LRSNLKFRFVADGIWDILAVEVVEACAEGEDPKNQKLKA